MNYLVYRYIFLLHFIYDLFFIVFLIILGGGHCPMDQIPELVNKEILRYMNEKF